MQETVTVAGSGAVAPGAATKCRGCGADRASAQVTDAQGDASRQGLELFTPADVNPRYCRTCLARIPFPGMDWQARLPGRLLALAGGETPAVFRCLADAAVAVRPLAAGVRTELEARHPGHGRELGDWLRSYVSTCGYLSALAAEGSMRHDVDGRPVAPVEPAERVRAASWQASPWVSGDRTDRAAHVEGLAQSGRCSMVGGRCMVTADGGPMGQLRIEAPASQCGRQGRGAPVRGERRRGPGR